MSKSGGYYAVKRIAYAREIFGNVCNYENCKVTDDLEFAHRHNMPTGISGNGRGSFVRLTDILENPANYILLCKPHHLIYDGKEPMEIQNETG